MSVLVSAGSLRASFQLSSIAPLTGSTDSHWLNWSLTAPVGVVIDTRSGAPTLAAVAGACDEDVGAVARRLIHPRAIQRAAMASRAPIGVARRIQERPPARL